MLLISSPQQGKFDFYITYLFLLIFKLTLEMFDQIYEVVERVLVATDYVAAMLFRDEIVTSVGI